MTGQILARPAMPARVSGRLEGAKKARYERQPSTALNGSVIGLSTGDGETGMAVPGVTGMAVRAAVHHFYQQRYSSIGYTKWTTATGCVPII
jgi:hypothetical protein